ncbi:hypothetical protein ACIBO5_05110 [Nonomuraea angiospora]|uniref:hypothetical protein n=1 Tax=Nonomuraea angiospora TaxID=46172 RepID=UPI0037A09AD3
MTITDVVDRLSPVARSTGVAALDERLASVGWHEKGPVPGGSRRTWAFGAVSGTQYSSSDRMSFMEVTVDIRDPESADPEDEGPFYEEFERKFHSAVTEAAEILGPPSFVATYGDQDFPDDMDAVMVAGWRDGGSGLFICFKHEDSGVPFRITAVVT